MNWRGGLWPPPQFRGGWAHDNYNATREHFKIGLFKQPSQTLIILIRVFDALWAFLNLSFGFLVAIGVESTSLSAKKLKNESEGLPVWYVEAHFLILTKLKGAMASLWPQETQNSGSYF